MISEEKGADLRKIIINVNTIAILIGLILFITGIKLPGITKDTVAAVSKLIAPLSGFNEDDNLPSSCISIFQTN